ncbi:MAG TPA: TIGR02757 family protein, partial [Bacteroidia bacterium]|nr:TIGR02757 family protein [Bacteroidia bacterium]
MKKQELITFLNEKADLYNRPSFIESDPISIPRRFTKQQDIEIAGFLAATIAWGQRPTIIRNANRLMLWMDESPHAFILNHSTKELATFKKFAHRTFNGTDCLYFIKALGHLYTLYPTLEQAFLNEQGGADPEIRTAISRFRTRFFSLSDPGRTGKHVSDPMSGSASKRINMFLRWMVRTDKRQVDFGIWKQIPTSILMCPLDVHSGNVARKLGLLKRTANDWRATEELTQ